MATVNTQHSPDLLTSLLVGAGSSSSLPLQEEVSPQFGFADFLDPLTEAEQSLPETLLPEEESLSSSDAEGLTTDGQLNALLAAAWGPTGSSQNNSLPDSPVSDAMNRAEVNSIQLVSSNSPANSVFGTTQMGSSPADSQVVSGAKGDTEGLNDRLISGTGARLNGQSNGAREDSLLAGGLNGFGTASSEAAFVAEPLGHSEAIKAPDGSPVSELAAGARSPIPTRDMDSSVTGNRTSERSAGLMTSRLNEEAQTAGVTEPLGAGVESTQSAMGAQLGALTGEPPGEIVQGPKREPGLRNREPLQSDELGAGFVYNGQLESAQVVTPANAGGSLQQDGGFQHSLKQEVVETATSRPAAKFSAEAATPSGWNSLDLKEVQASFDAALQQAAETFPLESVAQQIVEVAEPDSGWISLEIQPPELGKLEIMVSKQGDDYAARIIAHEASTGDALLLQQAELIEALGQHGLELKEVQITTDSGSSGNLNSDNAQRDFGGRQERQNAERQAREAEREALANSRMKTINSPAPKTTESETVQVNLLV